MNSRSHKTIQELIVELDDTGVLCVKIEPLLIQPNLRRLVSSLMEFNVAAADVLVDYVASNAESAAPRGGGAVAAFRARIARWKALGSTDIESACLKVVVSREAWVIELMQQTLAFTEDLQQKLYPKLLKLENTILQVEPLMREVASEAPRGAPPPSIFAKESGDVRERGANRSTAKPDQQPWSQVAKCSKGSGSVSDITNSRSERYSRNRRITVAKQRNQTL